MRSAANEITAQKVVATIVMLARSILLDVIALSGLSEGGTEYRRASIDIGRYCRSKIEGPATQAAGSRFEHHQPWVVLPPLAVHVDLLIITKPLPLQAFWPLQAL